MDALVSLILKVLREPLVILFRSLRKIAHSSFLFLLILEIQITSVRSSVGG